MIIAPFLFLSAAFSFSHSELHKPYTPFWQAYLDALALPERSGRQLYSMSIFDLNVVTMLVEQAES